MKKYVLSNHFTAIVIIISLQIIFGCQKSDDTDDNVNDPPEIEGSENLGSGYDVFDNYAEVSRVKAAILDVDKLNKDGLIEKKTVENSIFTTTSGESISEYSNSLKVSASLEGNYMFFSGAVETNFHEDRYLYESYSFATVKSNIQKTQLRLPIDMLADELKPYLTETARNKLNDPTVSPEYIFDIYGTHCLTGVMLGGRLDYSVSARTSDLTVGKSIEVYAEASFSTGGVSVTGSGGTVTNEEYSKYLNSQKKIVKTFGGQSEFGQDIINEDDYDAWINSIDENTVFCDYTQHGLVPVWEFADEQSRKNELMAAFDVWASDHEITTNPAPQLCILDVKVFFGNPADPLLIDDREYHRLNADLNASVGGSLIWIYYLLGYTDDQTFTPIAEICTIDASDGESINNLPGTGWVQLPEDLNKGAGGDLIYIAFRRSAGPSDDLLTGLRVEHSAKADNYYSNYTDGTNNWYAVMQGYGGIYKQDLNEGSGGWFIFLYYTNDELIIE